MNRTFCGCLVEVSENTEVITIPKNIEKHFWMHINRLYVPVEVNPDPTNILPNHHPEDPTRVLG